MSIRKGDAFLVISMRNELILSGASLIQGHQTFLESMRQPRTSAIRLVVYSQAEDIRRYRHPPLSMDVHKVCGCPLKVRNRAVFWIHACPWIEMDVLVSIPNFPIQFCDYLL
jgi:hypothetical protein